MWCKQARFQSGGPTLQQRLDIALRKKRKAISRREEIAEKEFRFINDHWVANNIQFGIAFYYEQDKSALLVTEDDAADTIKLESMVPPRAGNASRQFLEGILYFLVFGNHVLAVQSTSFKVQALEDHLRWLMQEASTLAKGHAFGLADQVLSVTKQRIRDAHVKDVKIVGSLASSNDESGSAEVATSRNRPGVKNVELKGFGVEILEKIAPDFMRSGRLQDAVDSNIECSLSIRYKYSLSAKEQNLLDDIAMTLRGVEDAEAVILLDDGNTISGDELKLRSRHSVRTTNGVIDYNDLFDQMQRWLRDQIASGNLKA